MTSQFKDAISQFYSTIRSLDTMLPFIASVLNSSKGQVRNTLDTYLEENAIRKENDKENPNISTYYLRPEHGLQLRRLGIMLSSAELAIHKVPESFIVTLISQYDAFLGNLLRILFMNNPELINASEKISKMAFF